MPHLQPGPSAQSSRPEKHVQGFWTYDVRSALTDLECIHTRLEDVFMHTYLAIFYPSIYMCMYL